MIPNRLTGLRGTIVAGAILMTQTNQGLAQGCVAVRGGGMCALSGLSNHDQMADSGDWTVNVSYRWLHSDRHFVGDVEQTQRQANHTEVVNDSHFFDLGLTYNITPRFSVFANLPFVHSDRSSLYEHLGNASGQRFHTQAGGLADVRASGYVWLWDPAKMPRGNIQVGLGIKAPTGESDATDTFTRLNATTKLPTPTLDYVDQSIQPGDGGWGFTVEVNAWRELFTRTYGYLQGYYLVNPENVNGTPTRIANINSTNKDSFMSIPDQYMARGGFSYLLVPKWGLSVSLGGRVEGLPAEDFLGDSDGFRRPGFSVTIEPGLLWVYKKWTVNVTGPVALYRNRVRSVQDLRRGTHGDAAFADYVLTAAVARRF